MSDKTVILFDPDEHYKTVIDLILSTWDMQLVGFASNLKSSEILVSRIEKKELKPDVAIIEAYMTKSEEDGAKIAGKLQELNPNIKIIGFSTFETEKWADIQAIKSLRDNNQTIVSALSKALDKNYELANTPEPEERSY